MDANDRILAHVEAALRAASCKGATYRELAVAAIEAVNEAVGRELNEVMRTTEMRTLLGAYHDISEH